MRLVHDSTRQTGTGVRAAVVQSRAGYRWYRCRIKVNGYGHAT